MVKDMNHRYNKYVHAICIVFLNVFLFLLFQQCLNSWKFDDPEFQTIKNKVNQITLEFGSGAMADFVPFLEKLPPIGVARKLIKFMDWFYEYMGGMYKQHQESYTEGIFFIFLKYIFICLKFKKNTRPVIFFS